MLGKVIEIYIPEEYSVDGNLIDVMNRSLIGFRIMTDKGIEVLELEANKDNVNILKDDLVKINKENNYICKWNKDGNNEL